MYLKSNFTMTHEPINNFEKTLQYRFKLHMQKATLAFLVRLSLLG